MPLVMLFGSESTINFPAMADAQQVDDVSLRVEGVDDAIISHPQPVTVMPFQAVMRKRFQPQSHLINFGFDARPDFRRQFQKDGVKGGVTNLQGRAHVSRLACAWKNSGGIFG